MVTGLPAAAAEADPFDGRLLPLELVMAHRKEIGLTRDQSDRIGELVVEMQKAVADKQWRMQAAFFDLLAVLDEPKVDEGEALKLSKQAVDTENEIKLEQLRFLIRLRNLLTEDQIVTLRARRAAG
ncbi:MAG: hypothetical protein KDI31_08755 [Pseudomonadales bacterium]|nr:hypothetical protein [Pseudomonadales bacterium]